MLQKRTPILIAAAALVAGAGAGAGSYAAFGTDGANTTTVVQQPVAAGSPASSTKTMSVNGVYRAARDGVVEITVTTSQGGSNNNSPFPFGGSGSQQSQAQGSGWVYDTSGHIVTNDHVVANATSISIMFSDGSKYSAKVVGTDASTDLAVLKVNAPSSKLHPLTVGDSSKLAVGDGVVAIGAPFGLDETVTTGIVSALDRDISSTNNFTISGAIQTDAAINHGNSGGPLLNMSGQVVGITTQIESDSGGNEGVGFAVPSNTISTVASKLVSGQTVQHPYLGVFVQTPANRSGAEVAQVKSGSPAADAGLKAGDVITSFGGQTIQSPDEDHAGDDRYPALVASFSTQQRASPLTPARRAHESDGRLLKGGRRDSEASDPRLLIPRSRELSCVLSPSPLSPR
jgi:putative serine protease PepD